MRGQEMQEGKFWEEAAEKQDARLMNGLNLEPHRSRLGGEPRRLRFDHTANRPRTQDWCESPVSGLERGPG